MELSNFDLKTSLLSQEHLESYQNSQKHVRTYEEIMETEIRRADPILKGHTYQVIGAALTNDDSFIISAAADNTVRVWSLIDRVQEQIHKVDLDANSCLTIMEMSKDNKFIVFGVKNLYVIIWSLESKKVVTRISANGSIRIKLLSISSDDSMICVYDEDHWVKVYDLRGNLINSYEANFCW